MFVYSLFSLLPFLVSIFWMAFIVLENLHGWKKGFMPQLLLLAFVHTALHLGQAVHYLVPDSAKSFIDMIYWVCMLSVYPVFYLFIKKIATAKNANFYDILLLVPAFAMIICAIVFKMTGSVNMNLFYWANPVCIIEIIYLCTKSTIFILRYNRQIRNFYSNTTSKTLDIMLWLMYLIIFSSVCSLTSKFLGRDLFYGSALLAIPSLIISAIDYLFFYQSMKIDFSAEDAASDQLDVNQILYYWKRSSSFIGKDNKIDNNNQYSPNPELLMELETLIKGNKMYLNPELKITDVVNLVASNRTYVSNVINRGLNMSFSDYINRLRVEEAMSRMITKEEGTPLKVIALEIGFNNDSSFYRHFRKVTGMTPVEWMKANINQKNNKTLCSEN